MTTSLSTCAKFMGFATLFECASARLAALELSSGTRCELIRQKKIDRELFKLRMKHATTNGCCCFFVLNGHSCKKWLFSALKKWVALINQSSSDSADASQVQSQKLQTKSDMVYLIDLFEHAISENIRRWVNGENVYAPGRQWEGEGGEVNFRWDLLMLESEVKRLW